MASRGGSRRRGGGAGEHESNERWLLTYSDMITLLLALFVVLFSISSVNVSKFVSLQQSLKAAFSGSILSGGSSILESGADSTGHQNPNNTEVPAIVPLTPTIPKPTDQGAQADQAQINALLKEAQNASQENSDFEALKHRLNTYARAHGFANQVKAQIKQQGLVVTVLTDNLLFASGQDTLEPQSYPLLNEISTLINLDNEQHPVVVEGYTDDVPISNSEFQSNWWLSSGRANVVLQYILTRDVPAVRLSEQGFGDQHPVASNATPEGRAQNRRVEVVFERKYPVPNAGA